MQHHLSLHYYVMFLSIALRGLKQLHYHSLSKVKSVRLPIGDDNLVALPSDFLSDVMVGYEVGDKVRPIGRSRRINARENKVEGTDVAFDPAPSNTVSSFLDPVTGGRVYSGNWGFFGLGVHWDDSYRVLEDQGVIRMDANRTEDHIHLVYLTTPTTPNTASVIDPRAEEALLDWIAWQWSRFKKRNRFEVLPKRSEFFNSLRIFRASKTKWNIHDIRRVLRKHYMLAPKN